MADNTDKKLTKNHIAQTVLVAITTISGVALVAAPNMEKKLKNIAAIVFVVGLLGCSGLLLASMNENEVKKHNP